MPWGWPLNPWPVTLRLRGPVPPTSHTAQEQAPERASQRAGQMSLLFLPRSVLPQGRGAPRRLQGQGAHTLSCQPPPRPPSEESRAEAKGTSPARRGLRPVPVLPWLPWRWPDWDVEMSARWAPSADRCPREKREIRRQTRRGSPARPQRRGGSARGSPSHRGPRGWGSVGVAAGGALSRWPREAGAASF